MGDTNETTERAEQPATLPWVRALAITCIAGLAGYDLTVPDSDVESIVYWILGGIALGVDLPALWGKVKSL